jgi:hypothetical protein
LKTPLDAQKNKLSLSNIGRNSSKKRHQDAKKGRYGGNISIESFNGKKNSKEVSNSDIGACVPEKKKRDIQRVL